MPDDMLCRTCAEERTRRRGRKRSPERALWDGKSYGSGAGRAHFCVRAVKCPQCKAAPGKLCLGQAGPKLDTHYMRRDLYRMGLRYGKK